MLDPIARAKSYPYAIPDRSIVLSHGRVQDWDARTDSLLGRVAVLAFGSNRSPEQLLRKFGRDEPDPLPIVQARLTGFDVVYSAHITSYGAVPATLYPSPGTRVELSINFLTPRQLETMHATEAVGVNYDYCRLWNLDLEVEGGTHLTEAYAYVSRRGALDCGGAPAALAANQAEGRRFRALDETSVLTHVRDVLAPSESVDDFITQNIGKAAHERRDGFAARLTRQAHPYRYPHMEIIRTS